MKLLTVALVGLAALVAASPVEPTTAAAASRYKNDAVHTYECDSNKYVLSCVRSGTCSFVVECPGKCVEDSFGATCTDSATTTAIEDRAVDGPLAKHMNDDKVTYHCDRDVWIIACPVHVACATIEYCLVKCIENQRGAECSPETHDKREIDSEVDAEDKKTYECAKDRTGVLVCQYGFCQTDHYCNKGWKCRDKCACCKKTNLFSREIDDDEFTEASELGAADLAPALSVVDSNTLATRDAPCMPGTYSCQKLATGESWITTCDYKGTWQYSANCGEMKCIAQSNGVAHCWNPGPEWDTTPSVATRDAPCMPGTYSCQKLATGESWITTCDYKGKWQYSANCGEMKCIAQSNGVAHCWNPGPEWDLTPVSRREESQDFVMSTLDGDCQTGLYSCALDPTTNTAWIVVCDADRTWQWLRSCGLNMKCAVLPPGSGNVHCLPMETLGARGESEEVPPENAPSLTCRPGSYSCTFNDKTGTSWVITCDQSGRTWLWSSDCGGGQTCHGSTDGTAHCTPGPPGKPTLGARDGSEEVPPKDAPSLNCRRGTYGCAFNYKTETSWVVTCNQSGRAWLWASNCGDHQTCHGSSDGAPRCVPGAPRPPKQPTLGARDEQPSVPSELHQIPSELAPSLNCQPGSYACTYSNHTQSAWVIVCDQSGTRWLWSSECGKGMQCVTDGHVAHCVSQKALFEAWEAAQTKAPNFELETRQGSDACDHSGVVACNEHIVVRCDNGHWIEIQDCGPDLVCAVDKDREQSCIPPMAIAASTLATVTVGSVASAHA